MPKNKIVFGLFVSFLLLISLKYFDPIKEHILEYSNSAKLYVSKKTDFIKKKIQLHFEQTEQIKELKKQVEVLRPLSDQSLVFATKLNQLLNESNLTSFNPTHKLSQVISYEKLDNPLRLWIEIPSYDPAKKYGLIYNGFTAGVVYPKFKKPLAYLQTDEKVLFSVFVGVENEIAVIFGNKKGLIIKYIPTKTNIKIGDEVVTSGKDGLFYEGIKVGKIVKIEIKNEYKIAIVDPYMKHDKPNFFYAIDL